MIRKNKDSAPSKPTKNYVYKAKAVVDGFDMVRDQLYFVHKYKNAKVAIERKRREEAYAAVAGHDPEIPRLEEAIAGANAAIDEAHEGIKKRNQALRKKSLATAEERERIKELKVSRKNAAVELKERKAAAYADPQVQSLLAPIQEASYAAMKAAYAESPAFWGSKLHADRSLEGIGTGAPPEFQRWSLNGSIAVQIQKGMAWSDMLLCNDNRARLQLPAPAEYRPTHSKKGRFLPEPNPESKRSKTTKRGLLWIRIGTASDGRSPIWAKILIHVHREPLPDTQIKWVFLHRYVVGRQIKWRVRFALSRDAWPSDRPGEDAGTVGVSIGWWTNEDGDGLTIATATGTDGEEWALTLSRDDLDRWTKSESLRAIRDRNFNAAKDGLLAWKAACKKAKRSLPDWLSEALEHLHQWKSPDRLQQLAWKWKDERFPADKIVIEEMARWRDGHENLTEAIGPEPMPLFDELAAWRRQDRHIHDWEDSQRDKAVRWRDEQYRRFVAILRKTYHKAVILDVDWAAAKREAEAGMKDDPETRSVLQVAAPGSLQAFLIESFGKENVEKVKGKDAITGSSRAIAEGLLGWCGSKDEDKEEGDETEEDDPGAEAV